MLVVIAGPSGTGKGTVVRRLLEREPDLWYSVSATDRPPRPEEVEGRDYRFVDARRLLPMRDEGGLLEWFEVYGDLKGTPRAPVEDHLANGDDVLIEVDVQGARAIRGRSSGGVPRLPAAARRVRSRRPASAIGPLPKPRSRVRPSTRGRSNGGWPQAEAEEAAAADFDAIVVNDDLDRTVDELVSLLDARRKGSGGVRSG